MHERKYTKPSDCTKLELSTYHWKVIEEVMPVLEIFYDATEKLASEQYPSASCIVPLLNWLVLTVLDTTGDTFFLAAFKNKIRDGLTSRFLLPGNPLFYKSLPVVASFLDPRHKSLKFIQNSEEKEAVYAFIRSLIEAKMTTDTQSDAEPAPKKPKKELLSCLDGDFAEIEGEGLSAEMERYIAEPVQIRNPLMWWKHYEQRFPSLASLARKILCVMGTSVPSERVFSIAGLTITKTRARLSPDVLDETIFLNKCLNDDSEDIPTEVKPKIKEEPDVQPSTSDDYDEETDIEPVLPSLY